MDGSGNPYWSKNLYTRNTYPGDYGHDIAVNTATGELYIAQYFTDTLRCDQLKLATYRGATYKFLAKLSNEPNAVLQPTNEGIVLYPNPASDVINLRFGNAEYHSMELIDAVGLVVCKRDFAIGLSQATLALPPLADGIYYLRLTGKSIAITKKILILH